MGAWTACAAILIAQSSAQEPSATFPVDGVVENSVTHQPIARALVEYAQYAVLTDSEGRFELHLPTGTAQVSVRRPGFGGGEGSQREAQHSVHMAAKMPPLTFYLTPSASITGHVTLSTGDEAEGLQFTLYRKTMVDGHSQWMQTGNAIAGSDGVFRLLSLEAPASYALCSSPFPDGTGLTAPGATLAGYGGGCYPGGVDLAAAIAAPLTLSPGQQADVEINLAKQWFYPVSIAVSNARENVSFQVFDRDGPRAGINYRAIGDHAGYEVDLPNGSYYAEARVWGKQQLYGRVDFTVSGAPVTGLTLNPSPVQPIAVEIHKEFTISPKGASGLAIDNGINADNAGIDLSMVPVDKPLDGPIRMGLRPIEDSTGNFRYGFDAPSPGAYQLQVDGYGAYASSITSGGTDLLREPLTIGAGKSAAPIEVTLRNDMGGLDCTAKSSPTGTAGDAAGEAEPSPVFVYAIPRSSGLQRIYRTMAGFGGNQTLGRPFALPLPPGEYLVVASKRDLAIDLDDPDQMSRIAAEGQTVNIQPGATTEVQVDPIDGGKEEANP